MDSVFVKLFCSPGMHSGTAPRTLLLVQI